jgi:protein-tyrosine kinase
MEKLQLALEKARQDRALAMGDAAEAGMDGDGPYRRAAAHGFPIDSIPIVPTSPRALARHRIITSAEGGVAVEAFRMLRTHVLNRLAAVNGQAIAVTSPHKGDGKTFVAVNLAVACAQLVERSAVLVDADLRQSTLCRSLGLQVEHDLSDFLLGRCDLHQCLVRPGIEELIVIPQRKPLPRSSELLASPRMVHLAEQLRRSFPDRIIIYDCPPLLAADDSLVLQRLVDRVLLVVQEGVTTRTDLMRAAELVGEERYMGSILNNARWHSLPAYYY